MLLQSSSLGKFLQERRQGFGIIFLIVCMVLDYSRLEVQTYLVTVLDAARVWTNQYGKPEIDAVAEEDACERLGNDTVDPGTH